MVVLAGDGVRSFFSEFSAGDARLRMRLSQKFFPTQRRQTSSDRSKEERRSDSSEECRHQCGILYEAEYAELTVSVANLCEAG